MSAIENALETAAEAWARGEISRADLQAAAIAYARATQEEATARRAIESLGLVSRGEREAALNEALLLLTDVDEGVTSAWLDAREILMAKLNEET